MMTPMLPAAPSGWDVYYVVFLAAVLSLAIPALLGLISHLVAPRGKKSALPDRGDETAARTVLGRRMNTRFFLSANAALVLITLGLVLIPVASTLQPATDEAGRQEVLRGLIGIVTIAGFAALGLLYAARKGDLNWLRTFREAGTREGDSNSETGSGGSS